jgi:hypothetical protein
MKKFREAFILTIIPLLIYFAGCVFFILSFFWSVGRDLFYAFMLAGFIFSFGVIPIWKNFIGMHDRLVDESLRFKDLQKKANEQYVRNEALMEAMGRVALIDAGIDKEKLQKKYEQVCSEKGITTKDDEEIKIRHT